MRKSIVVWSIIITFVILTGCGQASIEVSKLSPEQLVNAYYQSLVKGDQTSAKACLAADLAVQSEQDPSSDFNTIKNITSINVSPGVSQQPYGNYEEVKIIVQYNAEYKDDEYRNGMQTRSIIVSKKTSSSPWRITSIGAY